MELFKFPTYTVLLISSILEGSTFPVRGGAVGTTVPIMEMRGWEGRAGGVKLIEVAAGAGVGPGMPGAMPAKPGAMPAKPIDWVVKMGGVGRSGAVWPMVKPVWLAMATAGAARDIASSSPGMAAYLERVKTRALSMKMVLVR